MTRFSKYDSADYLKTRDDIAAYLDACLEEDEPSLMISALGDIARAYGMVRLASKTGLSREGLYKALSPDGNPSFATILKVSKALGFHLHASAAYA